MITIVKMSLIPNFPEGSINHEKPFLRSSSNTFQKIYIVDFPSSLIILTKNFKHLQIFWNKFLRIARIFFVVKWNVVQKLYRMFSKKAFFVFFTSSLKKVYSLKRQGEMRMRSAYKTFWSLLIQIAKFPQQFRHWITFSWYFLFIRIFNSNLKLERV